MSRIAKQPVVLPKGVEVLINAHEVTVKGPKGQLHMQLQEGIELLVQDGQAMVRWQETVVRYAGTTRALLANMVRGVSQGFERKLEIVGVGYRAQAKGKTLGLSLGFSHPVEHPVPDGLTVETPSQTEIIIRGADKQLVGQLAAEIRAYRPPEPYKGKGVRYADENVRRKEAKKK
ncbi:MAG: 50S ribosomal protein L6 [Acidithiobacillus sp.]|nr:50S ribosomal protein L6 [Acidithiobacillus sp.]